MSELDQTICVAPLTPTYSTLPRLNTTTLLLVVLASPKSSWVTKGALAALMARIATISIHAIVMLAMKDFSHPFELDSIPAWFILSEVAVAVPIMICWAPALRMSRARVLVKIWGVLVFIGAVCGYSTVRWAQSHVDEQTCSIGRHRSETEYSRDAVFSKLGSDTLLGKFDVAAIAAASLGLLVGLFPDKLSVGHQTSATTHNVARPVQVITGLLASVVLVALIVLHEQYLLKTPRLPMILPVTSYEQ